MKLWPHQEKTVEFAEKNKYAILALEMGLGKGLCALETFKRSGRNLLIVCPSYLISNWESEVNKFLPGEYTVVKVKGGKSIPKSPAGNIVIISYELAQRAEHLFYWSDFLVLDEANYVKSMKAKRTQFLHRVIYEASIKRVLLLTGTPIKNRVEEYYSLLAICNYSIGGTKTDFLKRFPSSVHFADYFSFRHEFDMPIRNRHVKIVKWEGIRNVEELKKYISPFYIRYKSSDVLDLPPVRFLDVQVSDIDNKELLSAFEEFSRDNNRINPNVKASAALETAPFTVRYARDLLDSGIEELVIYTDHVDSCEYIAKELNVDPITGMTRPEKRQLIGSLFQQGKKKVIVATVGSFSTGINLTRACHLIFNDLPWVPGDIKQAMYRIVRIGQERGCTIHRILGSPQAKYILKALDEKDSVIGKIV